MGGYNIPLSQPQWLHLQTKTRGGARGAAACSQRPRASFSRRYSACPSDRAVVSRALPWRGACRRLPSSRRSRVTGVLDPSLCTSQLLPPGSEWRVAGTGSAQAQSQDPTLQSDTTACSRCSAFGPAQKETSIGPMPGSQGAPLASLPDECQLALMLRSSSTWTVRLRLGIWQTTYHQRLRRSTTSNRACATSSTSCWRVSSRRTWPPQSRCALWKVVVQCPQHAAVRVLSARRPAPTESSAERPPRHASARPDLVARKPALRLGGRVQVWRSEAHRVAERVGGVYSRRAEPAKAQRL